MKGPSTPVSRWFRRRSLPMRALLLFSSMMLMITVATAVGAVRHGQPVVWGDLPTLGLSLLGLAAVSVAAIWWGDRREQRHGPPPEDWKSWLTQFATLIPSTATVAVLFPVQEEHGWLVAALAAFGTFVVLGTPVVLWTRRSNRRRRLRGHDTADQTNPSEHGHDR